MKKTKEETIKTKANIFDWILMTLICCSFVLFSTLAIWNTAMDMYGTDVTLFDVETERELPQLNITVLDTEYEVELSLKQRRPASGRSIILFCHRISARRDICWRAGDREGII